MKKSEMIEVVRQAMQLVAMWQVPESAARFVLSEVEKNGMRPPGIGWDPEEIIDNNPFIEMERDMSPIRQQWELE